MTSTTYWIAVAIITVVSSARLTRLATYDKFPPTKWLRDKFYDFTDKTERRRQWQILAYCAYCASFWITAIFVIGWGDLAGVYDFTDKFGTAEHVWFFLHGSLAASYLAAILMVNDGDKDED